MRAEASPLGGFTEDNRLARKMGLWFALAGIALLVLGLFGAANLIIAGIAATYSVGIAMLLGSIVQVAHAAAVRGWAQSAIWLGAGLLYLGAGLAVFYDPLFAARLFVLLLAASLAGSGLLRIAVAAGKRVRGRGWLLLSGSVSIVAALAIGLGWPGNSLWLLGFILAFDLGMQGIALLLVGQTLRAKRGDRI
ncbi:HdeD family acid-resistance protein [Sphingopyxis sp. YF1]|uniref:HdeD family acid-resistance protein n=1 Tax=Sphingopyxis sp. YF1 TaxID=2482763 RepID=UPI001F617408|nr:DUF308 domain-containing protein [Sphingopyxis sp. YF1]UNU44718.1 HdeD family acid-resistance protein [Sphingopyxis sp. YF1]